MIEQTKRIISEINRVHLAFSKDYFENGGRTGSGLPKVNLSHTLAGTDKNYIYKYRLYLHESINDYLMTADLDDINYYYRVKTRESIEDKIARYEKNADQYPVNNWLNDIFGARIVLGEACIAEIMTMLDDWQGEFGLKNWYVREALGYKCIHIYFKKKSNFFFPWELQIWDSKDVAENIKSHRNCKRDFMTK